MATSSRSDFSRVEALKTVKVLQLENQALKSQINSDNNKVKENSVLLGKEQSEELLTAELRNLWNRWNRRNLRNLKK